MKYDIDQLIPRLKEWSNDLKSYEGSDEISIWWLDSAVEHLSQLEDITESRDSWIEIAKVRTEERDALKEALAIVYAVYMRPSEDNLTTLHSMSDRVIILAEKAYEERRNWKEERRS
jgi:uncharacterized phage infection (PIP) family protein YhgE